MIKDLLKRSPKNGDGEKNENQQNESNVEQTVTFSLKIPAWKNIALIGSLVLLFVALNFVYLLRLNEANDKIKAQGRSITHAKKLQKETQRKLADANRKVNSYSDQIEDQKEQISTGKKVIGLLAGLQLNNEKIIDLFAEVSDMSDEQKGHIAEMVRAVANLDYYSLAYSRDRVDSLQTRIDSKVSEIFALYGENAVIFEKFKKSMEQQDKAVN